jgi:hypothetical protein
LYGDRAIVLSIENVNIRIKLTPKGDRFKHFLIDGEGEALAPPRASPHFFYVSAATQRNLIADMVRIYELEEERATELFEELCIYCENNNVEENIFYGIRQQVEEMSPDEQITGEQRKRVEELLNDPALLYKTKTQFLDIKIVGEDHNKLLVFLLELSGKTPFTQIITLTGESAVGKSHLAEKTACYHKTYKVGRLTDHAIDYMQDALSDQNVLYISELKYSGGTSLRLMHQDDGGIIVEQTVRDPETGGFTTSRSEIPPKTIITTTVDIELDEEFSTRTWQIGIDMSPEQTKRILEHQAQQERNRFVSFFSDEDDSQINDLSALVMLLPEVHEIVNPYADSMQCILDSHIRRVRRDFPKLNDLVKLSAFYHQFQRKCYEHNGKRCVVADTRDVRYAFDLAKHVFFETVSGLGARELKIVEILKEYTYELEIDERGHETEKRLKSKEIQKLLVDTVGNISLRRTQELLKKLNDVGIIDSIKGEGQGKPWMHRIKDDADANIRELEVAQLDTVKIEADATKFLSLFDAIAREGMVHSSDETESCFEYVNPFTGNSYSISPRRVKALNEEKEGEVSETSMRASESLDTTRPALNRVESREIKSEKKPTKHKIYDFGESEESEDNDEEQTETKVPEETGESEG